MSQIGSYFRRSQIVSFLHISANTGDLCLKFAPQLKKLFLRHMDRKRAQCMVPGPRYEPKSITKLGTSTEP